jgi:hypothetical protein
VITTALASSITTDNATLNGLVNPNGLTTNAWFEWGTDLALATFNITSPQIAMGAGTTDNQVNQKITGLTLGTTYYFRVAASNSAGTTRGAIHTFSTLPLPTVTTKPATSITPTGAILNADVNPNGLPTTAWFEWGTDNTFTTFTETPLPHQAIPVGASAVAVTAGLSSGLSADTTYSFRVAATSTAGTVKGTGLKFHTAGGVPTVATNAATSVTATGAVLNADVNPSALATTAWFEWGTDNTFASKTETPLPHQTIGSGTLNVAFNAPLTGLSEATKYSFRVVANNTVGTSIGTPPQFFTTSNNPAPIANAGPDQAVFSFGANGPTTVELNGSGSTDAFGHITSYQWTQLMIPTSTPVTLASPTSERPRFDASGVPYPGEVLKFQLTVTDNRAITSLPDNVNVTVKWGFLDDFSSDTTGTYIVEHAPGNTGTFAWDEPGLIAIVGAGGDNAISFTHLYGMSGSLASDTGVFSMDFCPFNNVPGGKFVLRLQDDENTYYEISNYPSGGPQGKVSKIRNGFGEVDNAVLTNRYTENCEPITVTFSPAITTVVAFGQTITMNCASGLPACESSFLVFSYKVMTTKQDATYDNFKLEAAP